VRFVGSVPAADELILAADLFVLTSLWEARALGRPGSHGGRDARHRPGGGWACPTCSPTPGPRTRPAGALVAPRDPAPTVAAAIDALLADADYREALAPPRPGGRRESWPDTRECVREWAAAYDGLLGGIA
jgi:hypothetical protein